MEGSEALTVPDMHPKLENRVAVKFTPHGEETKDRGSPKECLLMHMGILALTCESLAGE